MRLIVVTVAFAGALVSGCNSGEGVLKVDLNQKMLEIHSASELRVRKGSETTYYPSKWSMQVRGQDPITVVCGGQERDIYTTETVINVGGRGYDVAAGEQIIITPEGITVPTPAKAGASPEPAPAPAAGAGH